MSSESIADPILREHCGADCCAVVVLSRLDARLQAAEARIVDAPVLPAGPGVSDDEVGRKGPWYGILWRDGYVEGWGRCPGVLADLAADRVSDAAVSERRAESAERRAQRAERVIEAARDLTFCCDHPGASCRAWCSMCQLEHGRMEALHAALTAYDQEQSGGE